MYKSFIQYNEAFMNIYLCQSEGVKTLKVYLFLQLSVVACKV